ncbi:hypothetical protein ACHQM5_009650 [Ranunculus cassubicifolius]
MEYGLFDRPNFSKLPTQILKVKNLITKCTIRTMLMNDEEYKRKAIACFVQVAYLQELDRQENRTEETTLAPNWWNPFDFKDRFAALSCFTLRRPGGAPNVVLALRGTLLYRATMRNDIRDDVRFFIRESVQALKSLITTYGDRNVCVAGHSLGAVFALQVAKELADRSITVETHIFNPPSPSLAKCIQMIGAVAGAPFRLFRSMVASIKADSEKNQVNEVMKMGLQWLPNLYVNPSDFICCHYIFGPGAEKLFVLSKKRQRLIEAHALEQWWSDDLEFEASY